MKKYDNIFSVFWMGLGLFFMFFSNRYGLGRFDAPGPGLMPFLLGLLLLLISLYLLVRSFFKTRVKEEVVKVMKDEKSRVDFRKVIFVLASLFLYALLLERLGYLIVTLLTMVLLFWGVGFKRWRSILFASGLTVLITYFLFTYLGVRFPRGLLRFLGF